MNTLLLIIKWLKRKASLLALNDLVIYLEIPIDVSFAIFKISDPEVTWNLLYTMWINFKFYIFHSKANVISTLLYEH